MSPAKGPELFWFTENILPAASQDLKLSFKARKVYEEKTDYTHIQILDTPFFGRVLVLDDIISIAQNTEFIYHEMIVTLPCIRHGGPEKVLIIGGGDGGAAKHALRVKTVQRVVQVDIDKAVINACHKYMPQISGGALEDDRVELIIDDGRNFVKKTNEKFDVIVLDITEPVSWGEETLLSQEFLSDVKNLLNDGGVVSAYGGCLAFQAEKAGVIAGDLKRAFGYVKTHTALVPEFEVTDSVFFVCSFGDEPPQSEIKARFNDILAKSCQYLSPAVYQSSAVLPAYIQKLMGITQPQP